MNKKLKIMDMKSKQWYGLKPIFGMVIALFFSLSSVSSYAATGEEIFNNVCKICHTLSSKDLTGPGLAGMSERHSEEWLMEWIRHSSKLIEEGDEAAVEVFNRFNQIPMPDYPNYSDDELKDLIQYINDNAQASGGKEAGAGGATGGDGGSGSSGGGMNSTLVFWIGLTVILLFLVVNRYRTKLKETVEGMGGHSEPHKIPNYPIRFIGYLLIAFLIIYGLVELLKERQETIDTLLFIVVPYLSLIIFLIGSIYRYKNRGFQVSSLSTQFLEGKKLFRGSLPFHWGLFFLFFGHLIAFLFPSSVIAWNGHPVRLLILEFTAFAFGISALWGLILLIKRRMQTKMLLVVANKMDMVVYVVLFIQILSGLGVAYFVRWGSSWFAGVLTPYLRSVFSFSPDISAVVEMPWWVQIHIISAFTIIGIIPFTRFMHFLVAPFDYAWRRYQIVIWNWNPRFIRISRRYNFGKKPRNH